MKVNELYKIVRRNWVVKLICLVLAIFIYFFFYVRTSLATSDLEIRLIVSSKGNMVHLGTVPTHVKVFLKGHSQDLARISKENISAHLNLDYYTDPGEYTIPIQIELAPEILGITPLQTRVEPETVKIAIAQKGRKQIPVKPNIQGFPATGYEITNISVNPSTVGVLGAVPFLESMDTVYTDVIPVDERRTSFTQTVELLHDNELVSYSDDSVSISVTIQPVTITRRFVDQTVYLYGVNPLFVAQAEPQKVTFTLTGNQNQLEAFIPELHTVRLDCSSIQKPGVYELPVEIVLPTGIRLVSQNPRTVKVSFVPVYEEEVIEQVIEEELGDKDEVDEEEINEKDVQEDNSLSKTEEETSQTESI